MGQLADLGLGCQHQQVGHSRHFLITGRYLGYEHMYIGTIEVVIVVITVANPELKRRYTEGCGSESGSRRENLRKKLKKCKEVGRNCNFILKN